MLSEIEIRREVILSLLSNTQVNIKDSSDVVRTARELTDFILGKKQAQDEKEVLIPKGTRVKIQGCPFYLAEDTKVQDPDEECQRIMNHVLAEEKTDMDERAARRQARLDGCIGKGNSGVHASGAGVDSSFDIKVPKVQLKIINEIAETLAMLGAPSGLMACIGSWGDTLPQDEILEMWRDWNQLAKQKGWVIAPAVFA